MPVSSTDFSFYDLVPDLAPINLVDVGAAPTAKSSFYQAHLDRGHVTVTGFEPDPTAFARLKAKAGPRERYLPVAVSDGSPGKFHQTNFGFTSSLYPENTAFTKHLSELPQFMVVSSIHDIVTRRLDDVVPDEEIDYLKLDVQGGELDVFRGAPRLLATALAVEVEVEFVPLYADQPLFADIDTYLRGQGFMIHILHNPVKYFYAPVKHAKQPLGGLNQIICSDAVYIPNLDAVDVMPRERLLKLVAILHDFHKSWDLCLHILKMLADRGDDAIYGAYAKRIGT